MLFASSHQGFLYAIEVQMCTNKVVQRTYAKNTYHSQLKMDYQTIEYDDTHNRLNFSINFTTTSDCRLVQVEIFSVSQILQNHFHSPQNAYEYNATKIHSISVSADVLDINKTDSTTFFRLTAVL